jgi:hypothetical protein
MTAEEYALALEEKDAAWDGRERQLRAGGATVREALREREGQAADPFARFAARVLGRWIDEESTVPEAVLADLERLERNEAETPLRVPRPSHAVQDLNARYERRATGFVALRLVQQPSWAGWKVQTALLYLYDQADPETLPALVRFVTNGPRSASALEAALEALDHIGGRPLTEVLLAEALYWRNGRISLTPPPPRPPRDR